jgi:hypothetical protein
MRTMLHFQQISNYLTFDGEECRALGRSMAPAYQSASHFPHIVIDDFLDPDTLRAVLAAFPPSDGRRYFDRDQKRLKFQYAPQEVRSGHIRNLFAELNGPAFLGFSRS